MADDKAILDKGELGLARSAQKVELDLDDAIFLEDDDEPEAEPEPSLPQSPAAGDTRDDEPVPKPFWKKTWVLLGLLGFFLITTSATTWFVFRSKPSVPPPVEVKKPQKTQKKEPPKLSEFTILLQPFLVEHAIKGENRFLSCQFSLPVKGDLLKWEIDKKKIILRDAIYYYLKNKDILFLTDKKNVSKLKADLLSIVNQYLGNGQIEEILIQEYKVQ